MGCAFSFLTSSVRSRTSELVPNVNALSNDENVDKQQNESENCIRTQGSVCFSDSDLNSADQNRDQVLKGKPAIESVNGATYNLQIQIRDSGIVLIGDNNNIDFRQPSRKDMRSMTDNHVIVGDRNEIKEPYDLPSPGVAPQLLKVFKQMASIVDKLHPLRDKGKWSEFDQTLNLLQSEYESRPEIKCFLVLERCVGLTYRKRLEKARKFAEYALKIVNSKLDGLSREILHLLAHVALASIFRREGQEGKKLGCASDCLENAKQSGEKLRGINLTIPIYALGLLGYEQGRLYSEFAEMKPDAKSAKTEARKLLGFSIDLCRKLSHNNRLYTARQHFALIDLARLSIPNSSASKRSSLTQTKRYLEEFTRGHNQVEDTPVAAKIKYFMMESKLCILAGNYSRAEEHASKALNMARQYGFELEIGPAQDQIDRCVSRASQAKLQV